MKKVNAPPQPRTAAGKQTIVHVNNNYSKTEGNNKFTILYWNISGFNSLFNLDSDQINELIKNDILCFTETWVVGNTLKLPLFLKESYSYEHSSAIKEKSLGRASGGIAIFYKKPLICRIELLDASNIWLFVLITIRNAKIVVGVNYWKPTVEIEYCAQLVYEYVCSLIETLNKQIVFVIGGDFNSRIGDMDMLEEDIFLGSMLGWPRESLDSTVNNKGKILMDTMNSLGMTVCNGRTVSDTPGNYSFISPSGGKSTVDLVWISIQFLSLISDMKLLDNFILHDHKPCQLYLSLSYVTDQYNSRKDPLIKSPNNLIKSIKWDQKQSVEFQKKMSENCNIYYHSKNSEHLYHNMVNTVYASAEACSMKQKKNVEPRSSLNNSFKWFNSDCKKLKLETRLCLKRCKKLNYTHDALFEYILIRNKYRALIKKAKKAYENEISTNLANVKNSQQFWLTVKKLRPTMNQVNEISGDTWYNILSSFYKTNISLKNNFFSVADPYLDCDFSLEELQFVVNKCGTNKASGLDGIPYEIYKNLPPEWEHYLLNMFNMIYSTEHVPKEWSDTMMMMLFKKGCRNVSENYRGISLLNTVTKLFTSLIATRLMNWVESNNVFPEGQAGFRRGRSCIDNLFVLNSIASIHTFSKRNYLYAIFIDFRKAFDSIKHDQLWQKMYALGVSGKIIRILINLYEHANLKLLQNNQISHWQVQVTQGVLQGESLSPLLFCLYISDFEIFLRSRNLSGIKIEGNVDILSLLFADDIVLFADSRSDAQLKLDWVSEYCGINSLELNAKKTKTVVFRRSPKMKKILPIHYGGNVIEYVNHFTYLGIPVSSTGKFAIAANQLTNRGISAISVINKILVAGKSNSWDSKLKLFNSIVSATALYGSEIWSLRYLPQIEKVLTMYLKRLLLLPYRTPNYLVMTETGSVPLAFNIFSKIINYWINILQMQDSRYPKICFKRLKHMHENKNGLEEYNWYSQISKQFSVIGIDVHAQIKSATDLIKNKHVILEKFRNHWLSVNVDRCITSSYSSVFRNISSLGLGENYITYKTSIHKIRTIVQIRLADNNHLYIFHKGNKYNLDYLSLCTVCNMSQEENLNHFYFHCPIYSSLRAHYIDKYINDNNFDLAKLFTVNSVMKLSDLYYYTVGAFKLRSFIINE
uniref:Putative endonuclease-reverse transcriptase n=1 Tax=Triatoma infestans TaxID=30076 RepID=A0A023FB05_TRIIF